MTNGPSDVSQVLVIMQMPIDRGLTLPSRHPDREFRDGVIVCGFGRTVLHSRLYRRVNGLLPSSLPQLCWEKQPLRSGGNDSSGAHDQQKTYLGRS